MPAFASRRQLPMRLLLSSGCTLVCRFSKCVFDRTACMIIVKVKLLWACMVNLCMHHLCKQSMQKPTYAIPCLGDQMHAYRCKNQNTALCMYSYSRFPLHCTYKSATVYEQGLTIKRWNHTCTSFYSSEDREQPPKPWKRAFTIFLDIATWSALVTS